jgi:hemolysin activation/secretion protein
VSLADVYGISTTLTNKYRNEGYILTQIVVPPQTIEGGVVRLQVVEGFVDGITVEGNDQQSALQLVRKYASHIQTGKALNTRDLERYLLLIDDLPGVQARSILSPSKTVGGAADLRIIVERDPYDALLAIDNYGSRYLGPIQTTAAASANSYFGNNERITGQIVLAPDPNMGTELAFFSVGYDQPVWDNGTKVKVLLTHTSTEPGYTLDEFNVRGRSQFASVTLEHPFIRARAKNLYGHVTLDWRDVESRNILEPTRHDRIRALRAGTRYEFLDTMLGVGINSLNIEFAQGLNIFGSSDEGDANLTRPLGDPQFTKVNAEIQRLQRVTSSVNLLVAARGQWANNALLSSEEFGVGGIGIGRGFDPSEVVGDDGVAGKIEVQWNKPYPWNFVQDYQVYSFFDAGRVWNDDATTSSLKTDTLTSAGVGLRADFMEQTEAGVAVAFPLNRDVETKGDDDPTVYFNLSRRF